MRNYKILKTLLALSVSLSMVMTNELITVKAAVSSTEDKLQLKEAPSNSQFNKESGSIKIPNEKTDALKKKFGLIKPTVKLPKVKSKTSLKFQKYAASYDLRTLGKVTSVKNQGSSGSCWAFATYGSLESKLLTGENRDFSENNLKNNSGFDIGPNDGGNHFMSTAYLARFAGPINESDDPYNASSTTSPTNKTVQKHVQNVDWLSGKANYLDNNFIKSALMQYGAVYTSMFYEDSSFNDTYDTYYDSYRYWDWYGNNHAVTIVGWDDNFDRNKFIDSYNGERPAGNGAFIVKNSWGTSWGNNGYFYVSYYDENFAMDENVVFNGADATTNYKSIYQYDPLGLVENAGYETDTAWMSNVFTASSSDNLAAVSFYTVVPDSNYEVYVCNNYTGMNDLTSNRVLKASGSISEKGYHTIKLSSAVPVTSGKKFAVIIKVTTPGFGYQIPIEDSYSGYSSEATASAGQSYVSSSGSSWSDLTSVYDYTANVCIKAFTTQATNQPPTVASTSPTNGATNVAVGNNVTIKFSETILAGTNYGNITVKNSSGAVAQVTKTISGDTLTINPNSNLFGNTKYTVTIPSGAVKDSAGAALVNQYTFSFTTGANTAPTVKSTTPANSVVNVPNYNNISIKFSEDIFSGTNYSNITVKNSSGTVIAITKSITGDTLLIHPNSYLADNTKYTVTIPAGSVKDNQNLGLVSQNVFSFTTAANTAPIVVRASLPSTALDYGNQISVKFSEAIFSGTNYGNITVRNASGSVIGITKSISGDTLSIDPKGNLAGNAKYTVTIPASSVKDSKGLALSSQYTFTFSITTTSGRTVIRMISEN